MDLIKEFARIVFHYWSDFTQFFKRFNPKKHEGIPSFNLRPTQVYPLGKNFNTVLTEALAYLFDNKQFKINKQTPVGSIGSCFAEEFSTYMLKNKFNYLLLEKSRFRESANWGRVYTIKNFSQIVNYSLNREFPITLENSNKGWFDPLREGIGSFFKDEKDAKADVLKHRLISKKVLTDVEVLVVTLGQNEAWIDTKNGLAWAKNPALDIINKSKKGRFVNTRFSLEQNIQLLSEAFESLFSLNPHIKILLTVSPVPSQASFIADNVIVNSFAHKCHLRTVADEIIEKYPNKVFYFPSFEIVLCNNPFSYNSDNRHINYMTKKRIFKTLSKSLLKN